MADSKAYKNIFKTTFLFGFVQVFNILVKVGINKIVALILGPSGMGVIGLFQNATAMITTGAGLGISQSAVRDVSEANAGNDRKRFSRTISLTHRVILLTSLLGVLITIVLSPFLSKWAFGSNAYTVSFIFLSLSVGFHILSSGQSAILKGMRQLRQLAKCTLWGSIAGLAAAVPFYFFFREKGIVPSLITSALVAAIVSTYYVSKVDYDKTKLTNGEVASEAKPMIIMGSALMFTSLLASFVSLLVASYMRAKGGIADVGYYTAGMMIINGYFGVIITALTTDYYPRIAAVNKNDVKIQEELNNQSIVSLIICCPIIVLFLVFLPLFVILLYDSTFLPIIDFIKIGMFGTLITIVSNQVDMILVAKFKTKLFTIISIIYRILQVVISIYLYSRMGLVGMGVTLLILATIHMTIMTVTVYHLYKIKLSRQFLKVAFVVLLLTLLALLASYITNLTIKYLFSGFLIIIACIFSLLYSKNVLNIDFLGILFRQRNKR